MTAFTLDPLIAATSHHVMMIDECDLRLVNDSRFCWLLLIPQIQGLHELYQLPRTARHQLMDNASAISHILSDKLGADKMNIASIGNIVSQLHLHIIARHKDDATWPQPVWGNGAQIPYQDEASAQRIEALHNWLSDFAC